MERQESLPGLSKQELLESMQPDEIVDYMLELGSKASEIENEMNLASEVLEGAYGLTVEHVLTRRETTLLSLKGGEKQNGEQE